MKNFKKLAVSVFTSAVALTLAAGIFMPGIAVSASSQPASIENSIVDANVINNSMAQFQAADSNPFTYEVWEEGKTSRSVNSSVTVTAVPADQSISIGAGQTITNDGYGVYRFYKKFDWQAWNNENFEPTGITFTVEGPNGYSRFVRLPSKSEIETWNGTRQVGGLYVNFEQHPSADTDAGYVLITFEERTGQRTGSYTITENMDANVHSAAIYRQEADNQNEVYSDRNVHYVTFNIRAGWRAVINQSYFYNGQALDTIKIPVIKIYDDGEGNLSDSFAWDLTSVRFVVTVYNTHVQNTEGQYDARSINPAEYYDCNVNVTTNTYDRNHGAHDNQMMYQFLARLTQNAVTGEWILRLDNKSACYVETLYLDSANYNENYFWNDDDQLQVPSSYITVEEVKNNAGYAHADDDAALTNVSFVVNTQGTGVGNNHVWVVDAPYLYQVTRSGSNVTIGDQLTGISPTNPLSADGWSGDVMSDYATGIALKQYQMYYDLRVGKGTVDFSDMEEGGYLDEGDAEVTAEFTVYNISGDAINVLDMRTGGTAAIDGGAGYNLRTVPDGGTIGTIRITATPFVDNSYPLDGSNNIVDGNGYAAIQLDGHIEYFVNSQTGAHVDASAARDGQTLKTADGRTFTVIVRNGHRYAVATATLGTQSQNPYFLPTDTVNPDLHLKTKIRVTETSILIRDTSDDSVNGYYIPNNPSTSFDTYINGQRLVSPHNEYSEEIMRGIILHDDGTLSNQDNVYVYDHSTAPTFNDIVRGDFTVVKADQSDANTAYETPDDSINLSATFGLYNFSQHPVKVNGKFYQVGDLITTFTTEWDSATHTWRYDSPDDMLPYGTYGIVELQAPNGYWLASDGELKNLYDRMSGYAARYGYDYTSAALGQVPGYADGKVNGVIFTIRLASANEAEGERDYSATAEGQHVNITTSATGEPYFYNVPMSSPIAIQKVDGELHGFTEIDPRAQGDATLAGAEFTITNVSDRRVWIDENNNGKEDPADRYVEPGQVVGVITADNTGYARTSYGLGIGNYEVRETKAPEGYLLNETWVFSITWEMIAQTATNNATSEYDGLNAYLNYAEPDTLINCYDSNGFVWVSSVHGDATMYREYENIMGDQPIRGGVSIIKYDAELEELDGMTMAQGDATLAGARYTIWNLSENAVLVDKHNDGDFNKPEDLYASMADQIADFDNVTVDELNNLRNNHMDDACYVIETDVTGFATTASNTLPYGTYIIAETRPSPGYLLNESEYYVFTIRENGVMVPNAVSTTQTQPYDSHLTAYGTRAAGENNDPIFPETPIRGYLEVFKYDADGYTYRTTQWVPNTEDDENGPVAYQLESVPQGDGDLAGGVAMFYNISTPIESRYDGRIWYDADGNGTPTANEYIPTGTQGRDGDGTNLIAAVEFVWMPDYTYTVGSTTRTGAYVARLPYSVPYGTYLAEEQTAPQGYHWDSEWRWVFNVRENDKMYSASIEHEALLNEDGVVVNRESLHNTVYRNGMQGLKTDAERNVNIAQGDSELSGAIIGIVNMSKHGVWTDWDHDGTIESNEYFQPGEICYWCETDMYGNWSTDYSYSYTAEQQASGHHDYILPYGHYRAVELAPSNGYLLNGVDAGWTDAAKTDTTWSSNHVMTEWSSSDYAYWYYDADLRFTQDGVMVPAYNDMNQLPESVVRGGLAITKFDAENGMSLNVGGADLSDGSNRSSSLEGIEYTIWNASVTAYTDWTAGALTGDGRIWYDLNGDGQRANNELFPLNYLAADNVGDVTESYDGIIFYDKNSNGLVDEGELIPVGAVVTKIYTEWDPNAVYELADGTLVRGAYVAKTGPRDLPFGTYIVQETATNDSYLMDDPSAYVVTIREDGVIVTTGKRVDELSVYNTDQYGNVTSGITSDMILNFVESLRNGTFNWSNTSVLGDRRFVTSEDMVQEFIIGEEVAPTTTPVPTQAPSATPTPEPTETPDDAEPVDLSGTSNAIPVDVTDGDEPTATPTPAPAADADADSNTDADTDAPTTTPTPTPAPADDEDMGPAIVEVPLTLDGNASDSTEGSINWTQYVTVTVTSDNKMTIDWTALREFVAEHDAYTINGVVIALKEGNRTIATVDADMFLAQTSLTIDLTVSGEYTVTVNYTYTGSSSTGVDVPEPTVTPEPTTTPEPTPTPEPEQKTQVVPADPAIIGQMVNTMGTGLRTHNHVIRADFFFTKIMDSNSRRLQTIWVVTNVNSGERHVIMTDENGEYVSNYNPDEERGYPHSLNTNALDYLLPYIDAGETIYITGLDPDADAQIPEGAITVPYTAYQFGTWFGETEILEQMTAVDDTVGALPFGKYDLTEVRTSTNTNVRLGENTRVNLLLQENIIFYIYRNGMFSDLGTITNDYVTISTTAMDAATERHYASVPADGNITIVDTVAYNGLRPGDQYYLVGRVWDITENHYVLGADGQPIVAKSDVWEANMTNGDRDMTIVVPYSETAGHDLVVMEELWHVRANGTEILVAEHTDKSDTKQMVYVPSLTTLAQNATTGTHLVQPVGTVTINDVITYENLEPNKRYTVEGILMDAATGDEFLDANGNEITVNATFKTSSTGSGEYTVTYTFAANESMAGKTAVVFETLVRNDEEVIVHADLNDGMQQISFPNIETSLVDENGNKECSYDMGTVTLVDTVHYSGLIVGDTYTLNGKLMDKATGTEFTDAEGNPITSSVTFTATAREGDITVNFTFDASLAAGKTLVAFEEIPDVAVHADINDEDQTVRFPKIGTTAVYGDTTVNFGLASETVTITDTVAYESVTIGNTYVVRGTLMTLAGTPVLDSEGNPVTSEATFVAAAESGTVNMTFTVDARLYEGTSTVVFEKLFRVETSTPAEGEEATTEYVEVAKHEDITDEGQTIHFPGVRTTLTGETGIHEVLATGQTVLVDTVSYSNVVPGREYSLTGILMDKETGEAVLDVNGNEITATTTFTPETSDGVERVVFTIDASYLAGKSIVAFETLSYENRAIAIHADITDTAQTVDFPKIESVLTAEITRVDETSAADAVDTVVLTDNVPYYNVQSGAAYVMTGTIIDKATGEALVYNGKTVTASVEFTAEGTEGSVNVVFDELPLSAVEGKTLVAYERLEKVVTIDLGSHETEDSAVSGIAYDHVVVALHEDINDEAQTVRFPVIHTTATVDGEHIALISESVTITDVVAYSGLKENEDYVMTGYLVDKKTGEAIVDGNGNKFTSTVEFTTESSEGTVTVTFTVPGELVAGKSVVVFEECYQNETSIAVHADINDENQTVTFPSIGTTAIDRATGIHQLAYGTTTVVVDTVAYEGLIPGKTYTVSGTLMDKTTGQALTIAGATASKTFTAESANGSVDVEFTIDTTALQGKTLVAFETLTYDGRTIAVHNNIEDVDQTVYSMLIHTVANGKDGSKTVACGQSVEIVDTIHYENLFIGHSYTAYGQLVDKANGNVVAEATATFIPTALTGDAQVVFTVNTSNLAGHSLVAFETVKTTATNVVVGEHKDINDADQSVTIGSNTPTPTSTPTATPTPTGRPTATPTPRPNGPTATPTPVPTTGRNQFQTGITQYATLYVVIAVAVLLVAATATVGYIVYSRKKTAKSDNNDVN